MAFKKKIDVGSTQTFKFEKIGDELTGYYVGTFGIVIDGRDVKKHVFQTDKGLVSVLGQTHLTQQLEGLELGTLIKATFESTKKTKPGRQPMKMFGLEYDDEDKIDVGAVVAQANADAEAGASEEEPAEPEYEGEEGTEEEPEAEQEPVKAAAPAKTAPARTPAATASKPAATRPTGGAISPEQRARAQQLLGGQKR